MTTKTDAWAETSIQQQINGCRLLKLWLSQNFSVALKASSRRHNQCSDKSASAYNLPRVEHFSRLFMVFFAD